MINDPVKLYRTPFCAKAKAACEISDSQAALSRIRFRTPLCVECYQERKNQLSEKGSNA